MFKSLKEKISGWFTKKEPEKELEKELVEEKPKKIPKKAKAIKEKILKKAKKKTFEEKLQKTVDNISEEVPVTFRAGTQKFEPDVDKISEELEEAVEETSEDEEETEDETEEFEEDVDEEESEESEEKVQVEKKYAEKPKDYLEEELDKKEEKGFFARLRNRLSTEVLKEEDFEEEFMELELSLLENNVALEVVDKIKDSLKKSLVGISVKRGEEEKTIFDGLKKAIQEILVEPIDLIKEIKKSLGTYVILFFGINGAGKTTNLAKLASLLKAEGITCVMVAGDTFRAASIEQLEKHGENLGIHVVKSSYGSDPASVGFEAIQYAKKNKIKVVLIDTAGRMYTKNDLMKEMEKIVRVTKPNLKIFVGESIAGNDVVEQARTFNDSVGIDGVILSKADIDEKSGAILSVGFVTGKPILFLGMGQKYNDLKKFSKDDVLKGLGLE